MNRFSSLLTYSAAEPVQSVQARAQSQFPETVRQSRLSLRSRGTPIPRSGAHVILGIATYSKPELALLDDVDASLAAGQGHTPGVEVFNILDCMTMDDFEQFIPGIATVLQTPVVGLIVDGQTIETRSGLSAVAESLRRFHLLDSTIKSLSTARG